MHSGASGQDPASRAHALRKQWRNVQTRGMQAHILFYRAKIAEYERLLSELPSTHVMAVYPRGEIPKWIITGARFVPLESLRHLPSGFGGSLNTRTSSSHLLGFADGGLWTAGRMQCV
jgi:hypothetical protein